MRWTNLRSVALPGLMAIMLAGCQTPEQSMMSAEDTCLASGYRPGTRTYNRCVQTAYRDYRLESQATSNAVAAGAAAGLIGGAVVAASSGPYYGSGVYVGPGYGPYYGGYARGGYYRRGYYGGYRPYRGWGRPAYGW